MGQVLTKYACAYIERAQERWVLRKLHWDFIPKRL